MWSCNKKDTYDFKNTAVWSQICNYVLSLGALWINELRAVHRAILCSFIQFNLGGRRRTGLDFDENWGNGAPRRLLIVTSDAAHRSIMGQNEATCVTLIGRSHDTYTACSDVLWRLGFCLSLPACNNVGFDCFRGVVLLLGEFKRVSFCLFFGRHFIILTSAPTPTKKKMRHKETGIGLFLCLEATVEKNDIWVCENLETSWFESEVSKIISPHERKSICRSQPVRLEQQNWISHWIG